jgi:hypothetical protein
MMVAVDGSIFTIDLKKGEKHEPASQRYIQTNQIICG